jgi:hypothetical protein
MAGAESLSLSALEQDDLDLVRRTAELHAPVDVPYGVICRNCSWPYPCATRRVCDELLQTDSLQEGTP